MKTQFKLTPEQSAALKLHRLGQTQRAAENPDNVMMILHSFDDAQTNAWMEGDDEQSAKRVFREMIDMHMEAYDSYDFRVVELVAANNGLTDALKWAYEEVEVQP
jgi:hypothetical protein